MAEPAFWTLTPYRLRLIVDAHAELLADRQAFDLSLAWHIAAFDRQKTLPPLARVLGRGKGDDKSDMNASLLSAFAPITKRAGGTGGD